MLESPKIGSPEYIQEQKDRYREKVKEATEAVEKVYQLELQWIKRMSKQIDLDGEPTSENKYERLSYEGFSQALIDAKWWKEKCLNEIDGG